MPPPPQQHNVELSNAFQEIEDRAGPRSLAILVLVSNDEVARGLETKVQAEINTGSTILVSTTNTSTPSLFTTLAATPCSRLVIIFSTPATISPTISIPDAFSSCELVAAGPMTRVHLDPTCTYCEVLLNDWFSITRPNHELILRTHVYLPAPDFPSEDESPPPFTPTTDAETVSNIIRTAVENMYGPGGTEKRSPFLPWFAGGAAIAAGSAVLLAAKFEFTIKGAYVTAQVASQVCSGSMAAGTLTATGGMTLVAAGAAAVVAGAVVYFVPWRKLFRWMMKSWPRFVEFMASVWSHVKDRWSTFVKWMRTMLSMGAEMLGSFIRGLVLGPSQRGYAMMA